MSDTIPCTKCSRNNGKKRTTCIYCGEPLPISEATLGEQVPFFAPAEDWELAYTVVLAPLDNFDATERQILRLSEITKMHEDLARIALDARVSVPVLRVKTLEEADLAARFLGEADLGSTVVADSDLKLKTRPNRVRELRFGDTHLDCHIMFGDWVRVDRDDIRFAVEARIVATQYEIIEGQGKKVGEFDPLESKQFFLESYAIDIFCSAVEECYRIKADCFDFSCLGSSMSHRIDANTDTLGQWLKRFIGASRYDQNFPKLARVIEYAWPAVTSVNSFGLRAGGDLRRYKRSIVSTDGLSQFTRYSRTMFVLGR